MYRGHFWGFSERCDTFVEIVSFKRAMCDNLTAMDNRNWQQEDTQRTPQDQRQDQLSSGGGSDPAPQTMRLTLDLPDITSEDKALQDKVLSLGDFLPEVQETQAIRTPRTPRTSQDRLGRVAKAKKARGPFQHKALLALAIVAVLLIAGVGVFFWLTVGSSNSQAHKELDQAIALIEEADEVVIKVDAAIDETVTRDSLSDLEDLISQIPDAKDTLLEATDIAQKAHDKISSTEDREFAQHVIDSASARSEMLSSAAILLDADRSAMTAAAALTDAFAKGVDADAKMREAVETVETIPDASESKELNTQARDLFQEAVDLANQAQEAMPEASLGTVIDYFQTRLDSVNIAIESDQAVLDEDAATVKSLNKDYAEKDEKAVELAKQIPSDPLSLIYSAYDERVEGLREAYLESRAKASKSDVFIRQYREIADSVKSKTDAETAAEGADEGTGGATGEATEEDATVDSGETSDAASQGGA